LLFLCVILSKSTYIGIKLAYKKTVDRRVHILYYNINNGGHMVITGKENIANFRLITLRGALRLELRGMKRRGRSAYAIIKEEFHLKGSKQKVYDQFDKIVKERTGV
jgi:hypothetical protein